MKIKLISAIGKNNELGKNNNLIWHFPNDLKFFKETTLNKTVVMGYNTYKSLPKALKDRRMVVLYNKDIDGVEVYKNEYEMLINLKDEEEIFIIGGSTLYNTFIDIADELYLTEINAECKEADVYFPSFDKKLWKSKVIGKNSDNGIDYKFVHYTRKNKIEIGKLLLIEGTDCSGKETQSKLLIEKLNKDNIKSFRISFPMYDSPTGRIIGACLLGKPYLCEEYFKEGIYGWFKEGGGNIDPLTAIDFYAADRRYNLPKILVLLEHGINVILDRYVTSNMAHRGGMILDKKKRLAMYEIIRQKEYVLNELPEPDMTYLLYMPYQNAYELKKQRNEALDEAESNDKYLKNGEKAYLELAKIYNYDIIKCTRGKKIRTIEDINNELYDKVKILFNNNKGE